MMIHARLTKMRKNIGNFFPHFRQSSMNLHELNTLINCSMPLLSPFESSCYQLDFIQGVSELYQSICHEKQPKYLMVPQMVFIF